MSAWPRVSRSLARDWSLLRRRAKVSTFDDRELICADPSHHLTRWMSGRRPRWILVTTKVTWIDWLAPLPADLLVVQKYGLPSLAHVEWLRETSQRIGTVPVFAGDLDPLDLTVFAAWRSGNPAFKEGRGSHLRIAYGGIDDAWAHGGADGRGWPSGIRIAMEPFEREHWRFVKRLLPDVEALVGEECFRLLEDGNKIEQEGATNPAIHGQGYPGVVLRALRRRRIYSRLRSRGE